MKKFEANWQALTERARRATPRGADAPFGFAARVAALAVRPESPSLVEIWQGLLVRLLVGALALLLLCAALELPHLRDRHPWQPGIEDTVARVVWSL
jgi:hypothetical protein